MAPPRLVVGMLLALAVLTLLPATVAAGMALRHRALDSPAVKPTGLDIENMSFPRRMEAQKFMEYVIPPLFCYEEPNFDFVDNDIGSVPASAASQCCSKCHLKYMCTAWSWTNQNGGTCWLKSKRGAVIYRPGVTSSLVFTEPPQTCTHLYDTDFVDNDLARVDSPDAWGCCNLCKNYPGCRAFSYNNYLGGSCWLKSAKGNTVSRPGVISAEVYPNPTGPPRECLNLKRDVDYVDNDIGNRPSPTPEGCCAICKSWKTQSECRAFSWNNHNGGTCWLKSRTGESVPRPGVVSATVFTDPPLSCTIQYNVDYTDHDITNKPAVDVFTCCNICKEYPGGACKAFSWNNHNSGTCWLKSAQGAVVANGGVHSGIVI